MKQLTIKKLKKTFNSGKSRLELIKENRLKLKSKRRRFLSPKKAWVKKIGVISLVLLGILFIVGVVAGVVLWGYMQTLNDKLPNPDVVFPELPVASEIFDRNSLYQGEDSGTRLYRVFNKFNSDNFEIKEVPDRVKLPFIAAEDKEFFTHSGFNPAAILRCGINYIKDFGNGCGGSTITQQLVKITTQNDAPRLERKINELLMAMKVEQNYDKEQILSMYLRAAPFGSSIVGLKTAANFYFGKEPKDLTLAEAAVLASIIQDPVRLSPTLSQDKEQIYCRVDDGAIVEAKDVKDPNAAELEDNSGNKLSKGLRVRCRQLYVLDQLEGNMVKFNEDMRNFYNDPEMDDVLTTEMIQEAIFEDWTKALRPPIATDIKAGHFVNYVMKLLQERNYKNAEEPFELTELQNGGYKIYTTLDYTIQEIAERAVQRGGTEYSYWNVNNAALMTTIPSTGQIISWAGSKSYFGVDEGCDGNGQNCAYNPQVDVLRSLQEPGSSNKPMGYYLAFKDAKLFPGSFLPDIPLKITDVNGNYYEPKNWNGTFNGIAYTAEQALRDSRNLPAIEVVELIGVSNYVSTSRDFGYTSYTGSYGESVIIGGVSVYPYEHAQGYGVFANGGDLVELNPILKIVDKNGNTVYEAEPARRTVGDPQGIFVLNQTIKNYDGYSWDGRDMAGKTGTTNENWDAWFMGYSPDFVNVCWVGNNNNSPMDQNNGYPPFVVKPWCQDYFREIGDSPYLTARTPFYQPGGITQGGGDCNAAGECLGLQSNWMIEGRVPPRDIRKVRARVCTDQEDRLARPIDISMGKSVEREFTYYVMPSAKWQPFLDEYMSGQNTQNGAPTQNCDIDRTGGAVGPFYSTLSATVTGSNINIKGSVFSTDSTLTGISFTLGGQAIPSCTTTSYANFDITCSIATLALNSGPNLFHAIVTDSKSRTVQDNLNINVNIQSGLSFSALPPTTGLDYGTNVGIPCTGACPYAITGNYTQFWTLTSVQLWQKIDGGGDMMISALATPSTTFNWGNLIAQPSDANDDYVFYIVATTSTGGTIRSADSAAIRVLQ